MREPRTPPLSVVGTAVHNKFYVQAFDGRRFEYLGSDKLWHRDARLCDPFTTREEAEAAMQKEANRAY